MGSQNENKEIYRKFMESIAEMNKQPYKAISMILESSKSSELFDDIIEMADRNFKDFLSDESIDVDSLLLVSYLSYAIAGDKKFNDDITGEYEVILTNAFFEAQRLENLKNLEYHLKMKKKSNSTISKHKIDLRKITNSVIQGNDKRNRIKYFFEHLKSTEGYLWLIHLGNPTARHKKGPYESCEIQFDIRLFTDKRIRKLIKKQGVGITGKLLYQLSFGYLGEDIGKGIPIVLSIAWTAAYSTLLIAKDAWLEENPDDDDIILSIKDDYFLQLVNAYAQTTFHNRNVQYDETKFQRIVVRSYYLLQKELLISTAPNRIKVLHPNRIRKPLKVCVDNLIVDLQTRVGIKSRLKSKIKL